MLNQIFKQIKVNFAAKVKEKKDINKKFVIFCPTFYVIFVSNFVLRLFFAFLARSSVFLQRGIRDNT